MSGTDNEELRQLALGLLDRVEPGMTTLLAGLRERADGAAEHPPTCTWCPLCATVGLLRGERPELAAALAAHAEGLVATLRAALAPQPAPQPAQGSEPGSVADSGSARPRVQRIDIQPAGEAGAGC